MYATNNGNVDRLGFAEAVREHVAPVLAAQGSLVLKKAPTL